MRWRKDRHERPTEPLRGPTPDADPDSASPDHTAAGPQLPGAEPPRPDLSAPDLSAQGLSAQDLSPADRAGAQFVRAPAPVAAPTLDPEALVRARRRAVARALAEDLGAEGDLTSLACVRPGTRGSARIVARSPGVVSGLDLVVETFSQVDPRLQVDLLVSDGATVRPGEVIADVRGPLRSILSGERTALNFACQLSGIATLTRAFVEAVEGTGCQVRDTRKTTSGLRLLEKAAVVAGGGVNHRLGLYDALLVKDNHVAAAGGVDPATRAALQRAGDRPVQVEVTSLKELEEALAAGATDLLVDNASPDDVRRAVGRVAGRARVEASGRITLANVRDYAEAGADRVAVGALTHSAPWLDIALDVDQVIVPAGSVPSTPPAAGPDTPPLPGDTAPATLHPPGARPTDSRGEAPDVRASSADPLAAEPADEPPAVEASASTEAPEPPVEAVGQVGETAAAAPHVAEAPASRAPTTPGRAPVQVVRIRTGPDVSASASEVLEVTQPRSRPAPDLAPEPDPLAGPVQVTPDVRYPPLTPARPEGVESTRGSLRDLLGDDAGFDDGFDDEFDDEELLFAGDLSLDLTGEPPEEQ